MANGRPGSNAPTYGKNPPADSYTPRGGKPKPISKGERITILGKSFPSRDAAKKFFLKNPGWVAKNYRKLHKDKQGYGILQIAGYYDRRAKNGSMTIHNKAVKGGAKLWTYGAKAAGKPLGGHPDESDTHPPGWAPPPTRKGGSKPKPKGGSGINVGGAGGPNDPLVQALAEATGLDPRMLEGLKAPNGKPLSLALAGKGAKTMSPAELDALVKTIVGGESRSSLIESDIERMTKQGEHNVAQIGAWYDQVLASQAKAAERDKQFGAAAVQSAQDVGQAILSSIGGEAAEGAGMVGASTNANVGNLQAMEHIQNQYNEDVRPIFEAEKASQMTREQGASASRLRDLNRQLVETKLQASADEANLRYNVWQQNNAILNSRLDREMAIRQYNQGLPQQRFGNQVTLAQMALAAQAQNFGQEQATAQFAAGRQDQAFNKAMAIRQWKAAQSQKSPDKRSWGSLKVKEKKDAMDLIWNTVAQADSDGNVNLRYDSAEKALAAALNTVQALGYSPRNPAVAAAVRAVIEQTYA